jgi:WhiB family redox-sensing transcriptional regulator
VTAQKTCRACERDKPVAAFARHKFSKDGHVHTCSECRRKNTADDPAATRRTTPRRSPDLPRPNWGWQNEAACRGENLELFFGPEGERQPERDIRERQARNVCMGCPVRTSCLDYAVSRPEKYGTWGALNEEQRGIERRRRMRRAA